MGKVKEIREVYLSSNKAAYSSFSGTILINKPVFKQLDKNERTFILLHEAGHIELTTKDENQADAYAFNEYVKLGLPVASILTAMNKVLSHTPQNIARTKYMEQRMNRINPVNGFGGALTTADWLSLGSQVLGVGSQIAGGSSTADQIAKEEALRAQQEAESKKTMSYIIVGVAIVAIVIVGSIIFKK